MTDVEKDIEYIKEGVERIELALFGNGKIGIKTQTELNKASITRLWWTIPLLSAIFLAIVKLA